MKRLLTLAIVALSLAACNAMDNPERADTQRVSEQQKHYALTQPVPYFDFSMDRDTLIQIYKAKNEARTTWSVFASAGTGDVTFICESIGFAIPADTSLTNPLQIIPYGTISGAYDVVEQPEPNGLYSSKNTDGTYVQCVGEDGNVSPVYTEQKVTTFPFPVAVAADGKTVERAAGDATITLDVKSGSLGEAPVGSPTP